MRQLVAENLSHWFDTKTKVLDHLNLTLNADGSSLAIVGPSGSGKTTLLALLGGLLKPREGSVLVRQGQEEMPVHSSVSWVLQTTNLLPKRTVWDNVALGMFPLGLDKPVIEQRVTPLLASVGLVEQVKKPARQLSGGEAQRLSVARAIATQAPFLLADEPTGQLDKKSSERVAEALFGALNDHKVGLLLVTHDHELAHRCDRVYALDSGRFRV